MSRNILQSLVLQRQGQGSAVQGMAGQGEVVEIVLVVVE
jgi:hypothetical protein